MIWKSYGQLHFFFTLLLLLVGKKNSSVTVMEDEKLCNEINMNGARYPNPAVSKTCLFRHPILSLFTICTLLLVPAAYLTLSHNSHPTPNFLEETEYRTQWAQATAALYKDIQNCSKTNDPELKQGIYKAYGRWNQQHPVY